MYRKNLFPKFLNFVSVMGISVTLLGSAFTTSSLAMELPDDPLDRVFSFSSSATLGAVAQVSRTWNRVSANQKIWWHPNGCDSREPYDRAYAYIAPIVQKRIGSKYPITAVFKPTHSRNDLNEREVIIQHNTTIKDVWLDAYNYERADKYPWLTLVYYPQEHINIMQKLMSYFLLKYRDDPLKVGETSINTLTTYIKSIFLKKHLNIIHEDAKKYFNDITYQDEIREKEIQRGSEDLVYKDTDIVDFVDKVLIPHCKKAPSTFRIDNTTYNQSGQIPVDACLDSFWDPLLSESWN